MRLKLAIMCILAALATAITVIAFTASLTGAVTTVAEESRRPVELFCMIDGVASHQSDTFEKVHRPYPQSAPFAWELSGDGLTGWTWFYIQEPGESCVVRESARAWMKAEPAP